METGFADPNNEVIKKLIRGFRKGDVTTLYGNAASGKTTSCLLSAIAAASTGKVIFVDTEGGFNPGRMEQLHGGDISGILENIFLLQPKTFEEQHDTIMKLHQLCQNPKISQVIVDTIGNKYRNVLPENPEEVNTMMLLQMQTLYRVARDMQKTVLLTNQVYADMQKKDEIKMVGGNIVKNLSRVIIELNKKDDRRYATLVKYKMDKESVSYYYLGKVVRFDITESGLQLTYAANRHFQKGTFRNMG